MKNIAIFCDGTWQYMDQPHPTNVANLARSTLGETSEGVAQLVYYDDGVGVGQGVLDVETHLLGGVLGKGLDYKIVRAYEFLALNFEDGDRLFIFGFSRGAYTARCLGGLIRWFGILKRENAGLVYDAMSAYRSRPAANATAAERAAFEEAARTFRSAHSHHAEAFTAAMKYDPSFPSSLAPKGGVAWIQYMGVWDTVGSLGIPTNLLFAPMLDAQYRFYDTSLSRCVRSARHAVSIDERRRTFAPTLWGNIDELNRNLDAGALPYDQRPYQQQWFPGDHGRVGGGEQDGGVSLAAMLWVAEGAARAGLALDQQQIGHYATLAHPDARFIKAGLSLGEFLMEVDGLEDRAGPNSVAEVSLSARLRWSRVATYRPVPLTRHPNVADGLTSWAPQNDPQPYYAP